MGFDPTASNLLWLRYFVSNTAFLNFSDFRNPKLSHLLQLGLLVTERVKLKELSDPSRPRSNGTVDG